MTVASDKVDHFEPDSPTVAVVQREAPPEVVKRRKVMLLAWEETAKLAQERFQSRHLRNFLFVNLFIQEDKMKLLNGGR